MIILSIFKNNRLGGILFIVLLMTLLWLKSFISPIAIHHWEAMPLYHILFDSVQQKQVLNTLISIVFYIAIILILVKINTQYFLLPERSFMPASMFLMLTASFPNALMLNPFIISSLFLLIVINILISSDEDRSTYTVFNAAIFLGLGSLFYLKLIWFIPFIWIASAIIKPLKWREFLYPILVFLIIALFYFTYYWVVKDDVSLFVDLIQENLAFSKPQNHLPHFFPYLGGFVILLSIIASVYMIKRFQVKKIIIRKVYQIFLLHFIYATLFILVIAKTQLEAICILAVPLSYLFSNYFHRKKNHWIHSVLMLVWLAGLAYLFISS